MLPLAQLLLFCGSLHSVNAQRQTQPSFNISVPIDVADNVSECEPLQMKLLPLTNGSALDVVPPFYVLSFELGGIGRADFLGADPQNLTWTVPHPQGTQLLFYIVDGAGNMSDEGLSAVLAGNTTNCHPTQVQSNFKVSVDSSQVATCDDLIVAISGGTKPYTVTVVGDTVLNYTLGANDDSFDYVNQIAPSESFIITASDAKGQWAVGTNLISSVGSTDLSCPGKEPTGLSSSSSSSDKGPIVGGIIGGIVVLLLAIGTATYFYIKRRRDTRLSAANRRQMPFDDEDVSPYVLPPDSNMQMQSLSTPLFARGPPSSVTVSESASGTLESAMLHNQRVSRNPTLLSGEHISSHSGSVYSTPDVYHVTTRLRPMTEKERVMAREEEIRRQKEVVQHVDADDILDVPPEYKERAGRPSGNSAARI
ncbi:hypothetical protein A7U60_g1746 [Sanghuangporus baumii]|uniref:Uncharacterized protein n=1 Tax=Sanghuangporus baumii TaxID=108892 RepID=A0A9Q5I3H7_SANBA|nr:hypothetical protein A7U60_g1746 [Sanghuangporus baumii]